MLIFFLFRCFRRKKITVSLGWHLYVYGQSNIFYIIQKIYTYTHTHIHVFIIYISRKCFIIAKHIVTTGLDQKYSIKPLLNYIFIEIEKILVLSTIKLLLYVSLIQKIVLIRFYLFFINIIIYL